MDIKINKGEKMKRFVIENNMEIICLHQILEDYKDYIKRDGLQLSAITSQFVKESIKKLEDIERILKQ